jgi:hypothetical protein
VCCCGARDVAVVVAVVLGAVLAKKLSPAVAQRALFATIEHHFYSCFKERTSANMDMRANKQFRKQEGNNGDRKNNYKAN